MFLLAISFQNNSFNNRLRCWTVSDHLLAFPTTGTQLRDPSSHFSFLTYSCQDVLQLRNLPYSIETIELCSQPSNLLVSCFRSFEPQPLVCDHLLCPTRVFGPENIPYSSETTLAQFTTLHSRSQLSDFVISFFWATAPTGINLQPLVSFQPGVLHLKTLRSH